MRKRALAPIVISLMVAAGAGCGGAPQATITPVSPSRPPTLVPAPTAVPPTSAPTLTPIPTVVPPTSVPTAAPTPWPKSRADWTSYTNSNDVSGIAFDHDGYLWAVSDGGLVRWDLADGSHTKYTVEHGLVSHSVTSVAVAPDGVLWFGTHEGLARFDPVADSGQGEEMWTTYTWDDGLPSDWITSVFVAPDGTVWIGTLREGVARYDGETWTTYTTDDGLVSNDVRAIAVAPDGAVWFGTCALWGPASLEPPPCFGVSRFDPSTGSGQGREAWTTYADTLPYNRVNTIAVAPDGALWFGTGPLGYTSEGEFITSDTSGGVSRFDGQVWTTYTRDDGLADNWVNGIAAASDGTLWFATGGGVSRFDPSAGSGQRGAAWVTYTTANGLASDWVTSAAAAPDGMLCFGTAAGVSCLAGETWTTYTTGGPASNLVSAIAVAPDGTVWAGSGESGPDPESAGRGLSRFDPSAISEQGGETWTIYTTEDGLASDTIADIAVAPDGGVWIAAGDPDEVPTGVSYFDPSAGSGQGGETWVTYAEQEGLSDSYITSIAITRDGAAWFASWEGLWRFDGERWKSYETIGGPVAAAPDGTLWAGDSFGGWLYRDLGGLWHFDGERSETYTGRDGLVSEDVQCIAVAPDGVVWVGTAGAGVSRFDPSAGSGQRGEAWLTYTTADGLVDNYVESIAVAADGVAWFATLSGVSRFDGQGWTTYTQEDGLADYYVHDVAVGPDGSVWFATHNGIARYRPVDVAVEIP